MEPRNTLKYLSAAIAIVALTAILILAYTPAPTQAQSAQDSDDLAKFVAIMQYIRSTPAPADVKAANIPFLATLDTSLSDIYITGFITPYTGETPDQVKARLQSVPAEDRFTAVMVESYRLTSNPLLLDIIHQLLPLYYVEFFTTAADLNASAEFLKRADIESRTNGFDSSSYAIPAPSATQAPGGTSPSTRTASDVDSDDLAKFVAIMQYIRSQPTPADVKAANIPFLATLDTSLSDIYITGFITPYTGETADQVKARLQSVPAEDRFTAVMVESYRLTSNPLLLDIIHQLLPLYYVQFFTTAADLNASAEFLKRADIQNFADGFDSTDYAIPAPSATEPPDTGSPEMDRAALVALYNATDGDNWEANSNWLTDKPLNTWSGVTTDDDGRVIRLDNYAGINQLTGAIPPELGNLTKLEYLSLTRSQLTGAIPPELGNLARLNYLDLWENDLSGSIPPQLGNLTSLTVLSLRSNQLSGSIPPELGNLTNLGFLSLSGNQLIGTIPPELGNLTSLERLYLGRNQLSGSIPPELGNLTNLETLGLDGNQLTGAIPPELGNLPELSLLFLGNNNLTGCIPNALGDIWRNDFSELGLSFCAPRVSDLDERVVLEAIYNATGGPNWSTSTNWLTDKPHGLWYGVATDGDGRVTSLSLPRNHLSGSISTDLGSLSNLQYLNFIGNQLGGSIPPSLGNLSNLEHLYLNTNELSGAIPPSLGNLTNLAVLSLNENQLEGEVPSSLGNLANLQILDLDDNLLTGSLPRELTNLTELRNFWFNNPQLCAPDDETFQTWLQGFGYWSGNTCAALADRAALVAIYNATDGPNWSTSTNWLSDRPIGEWYNVGTDRGGRVSGLWLPYNNLSGALPPELDNLTNLRSLELHRNQLTGSIPPELGDMTSLVHLQLGGNQLEGAIPPELGDLANLEGLYLWDNDLNGSVPPSLGNLSNLESLSLSGNRLTGEIPSELGSLANLTRLWLNRNQLSGELPHSLTAITGFELFRFHDNDGLCAPTDAAFMAWIQAIPRWSGPDCEQVEAIALDRAALVALYNATDGPNWSTSENWLSDRPLWDWRGVNTDGTGRVSGLWLGGNNLSGSIPSDLGTLSKLERLDLSENQLSGSFPAELGNLASLEQLLLSDNALSGSIPAELGDLANLERLFLYNNALSGGIPAEFGDLASLEELHITGNNLSGSIPTELGNLTNLEYLRLGGNEWTGCIPNALGNTLNNDLYRLGLSFCDTRASDTSDKAVLEAFYNATDGPNWSGATNWLGEYPISLWRGVSTDSDGRVTALNLHYRGLSGDIPSELATLTNLRRLNLSSNSLTGAILPQLGNLANLRYLRLSDNSLTGSIPTQLGNLSNLERLFLEDNQLTGEIPSQLGDLANLEWVDFSGNQLTGCIPLALEDVRSDLDDELGLDFCAQ